jgi:hypothetical protein
MAEKKLFSLVATVSTENREAVRPVLEELVSGRGSVTETATGNGDGSRRGEFSIEADQIVCTLRRSVVPLGVDGSPQTTTILLPSRATPLARAAIFAAANISAVVCSFLT